MRGLGVRLRVTRLRVRRFRVRRFRVTRRRRMSPPGGDPVRGVVLARRASQWPFAQAYLPPANFHDPPTQISLELGGVPGLSGWGAGGGCGAVSSVVSVSVVCAAVVVAVELSDVEGAEPVEVAELSPPDPLQPTSADAPAIITVVTSALRKRFMVP